MKKILFAFLLFSQSVFANVSDIASDNGNDVNQPIMTKEQICEAKLNMMIHISSLKDEGHSYDAVKEEYKSYFKELEADADIQQHVIIIMSDTTMSVIDYIFSHEMHSYEGLEFFNAEVEKCKTKGF